MGMHLRRWLSCLTLLALLAALSACGPAMVSDEERANTLIDRSTAFEAQLRAGDYAPVLAEMDENCAAAISADQLDAIYTSLTPALGDYLEAYGSSVRYAEASAGTLTVSIYSKYQLYGTETRFTYNQDDQISGLYIQLCSLPGPLEETDAFTEEVLEVGAHGLSGKLTLPKGVEKPPVAILLPGSGAHDMDETIGAAANKPFRDIAHGLAERGIASIRFDKRFYAYPALAATEGITIEHELLEDAQAAIELAAAREDLDRDRIYLIGHSLGGMAAPRLAAEDGRVAGVVLLAGSPRNLADIVVDQSFEALEQAGLSSAEILAQIEPVEAERDAILALDTGSDLNATLLGQPAGYWLSLNGLQPDRYAAELACPMLILQGADDFQVYPDRDFAAWQQLLEGHDNVTFRLYEGLNHLFMPSEGIRAVTDYDRENHVDPAVLDDIAAFLLPASEAA